MMCDFAIHRRNRSPKTNITQDNELEYPKHPFPAALCVKISALPEGLREMALNKLLSIQVISLLHKYSKVINGDPAQFQRDTSIAVEMMRLLMGSNATALEKTIILLCFVLGRYLSDATATSNSLNINSSNRTYNAMRQPIQNLMEKIFEFAAKPTYQDFVVWGAFVLALASAEYGVSDTVRNVLLSRLPREYPAARRFDTMLNVLEKFFFHSCLREGLEISWTRMNNPTVRSQLEPK